MNSMKELMQAARGHAKSKGQASITHEIEQAFDGAHVIYAKLGQP